MPNQKVQEEYCEAVKSVRYESSDGTNEMVKSLLSGADVNGGTSYCPVGNVILGYGPAEIFALFGGDPSKIDLEKGPKDSHLDFIKAVTMYDEITNNLWEDTLNLLHNRDIPIHSHNGRNILSNKQIEAIKELASEMPWTIQLATTCTQGHFMKDIYPYIAPQFMSKLDSILGSMEGKINLYNYKVDLFYEGYDWQSMPSITYISSCKLQNSQYNDDIIIGFWDTSSENEIYYCDDIQTSTKEEELDLFGKTHHF